MKKTSVEDKAKIYIMFAKLFYACNISFAVVESDVLKSLIHISNN